MKKFDHLEAIEYLLSMDTHILSPETYRPWFLKPTGMVGLVIGWIVFLGALSAIWLSTSLNSRLETSLTSITITISILTMIVIFLYLQAARSYQDSAKHKAVQQMMRLEKRDFMAALEPFVPSDQKQVIARIIKLKDFHPKEYASVTLATKSRVLSNTEAFMTDIERMLETQPSVLSAIAESPIAESPNESIFKVSDLAKTHYAKQHIPQLEGTFNDQFCVPEEVKYAILLKIYQAAARKRQAQENQLTS